MMLDLLKSLLYAADYGIISRKQAQQEFMNTVKAMQRGLEVGLFVAELEKKKK